MKKIITLLFSLIITTSIYSKDYMIDIQIPPIKELDKIEINNGTRLDEIKGVIVSADDNFAVGFHLKSVGDKFTIYCGDWKSKNYNFKIYLFDIPISFESKNYIHTDGDDLYICIVERPNK